MREWRMGGRRKDEEGKDEGREKDGEGMRVG